MSNPDVFGSPMVLPGVRPASPFGAAIRPTIQKQAARGAAEILRQIIGPLARRLRIRKTVKDLSQLDDHILRDIGLNRSMIISTAHETEERSHSSRNSFRMQ